MCPNNEMTSARSTSGEDPRCPSHPKVSFNAFAAVTGTQAGIAVEMVGADRPVRDETEGEIRLRNSCHSWMASAVHLGVVTADVGRSNVNDPG